MDRQPGRHMNLIPNDTDFIIAKVHDLYPLWAARSIRLKTQTSWSYSQSIYNTKADKCTPRFMLPRRVNYLNHRCMTNSCMMADDEARLATTYSTQDRWCTNIFQISAHRVLPLYFEIWRNKYTCWLSRSPLVEIWLMLSGWRHFLNEPKLKLVKLTSFLKQNKTKDH